MIFRKTNLVLLIFMIAAWDHFESWLEAKQLFLQKEQNNQETVLHLCDVLQKPEQYNGKQITVKATYRVGFENSQMYCMACLSEGYVWMDTAQVHGDVSSSVKKLYRLEKEGGTLNGIFTGTFYGPGFYGHMGTGKYEIKVEKIRELKLIGHTWVIPEVLPKKIRQKVCH